MKKVIFFLLFLIIFSAVIVLSFLRKDISVFENKEKTIIIDAGHGLPDGGAVASDGTIESDINLEIAKKLETKLNKVGFNCIMLRCDSESIFTEGNTIHAKKVSDIRRRVEITNSNPKAFVISIHMNTFPDSKVSGAQFFYKPSGTVSKEIAEELQALINPKKEIKPISSNIYYLNHIRNDCVLAECGFLTNTSDLMNFKSDDYLEKFTDNLAEVIIFKFSGSDKIDK